MVEIISVSKRSLAEKAGLCEHDILVSINENEINDILDYRFYLAEKELDILFVRNSEERHTHIKKGEYDDIGLDFATPLMDVKHSCKNKCIFCFIDQLPKGMRETLYFKDDDSRLSFLHGNYITLTNMKDSDIDRIIKMHISPVNVSVHTTNPELRVKMMKNKRAGEVLKYLDKFSDACIKLHAQIVLCKGINDGIELERTLLDLKKYYPSLESLSVVPSGLTKYREGLYPLLPFTREDAADVIALVDKIAEQTKKEFGTRLFYSADEFYIMAGKDIPESEYYEEYMQLENGVGMIRSLLDEFDRELEYIDEYYPEKIHRELSVATGVASYPYISYIARQLECKCPGLICHVYEINNHFFGESITVSGLLTGKDIHEQLSSKKLGEELLIPENTLKAGEDMFLCDMTTTELSQKLGVKVTPAANDGAELLRAILGACI